MWEGRGGRATPRAVRKMGKRCVRVGGGAVVEDVKGGVVRGAEGMECKSTKKQGARGQAMESVNVWGVDDALGEAGRGRKGACKEGLGRVEVMADK